MQCTYNAIAGKIIITISTLSIHNSIVKGNRGRYLLRLLAIHPSLYRPPARFLIRGETNLLSEGFRASTCAYLPFALPFALLWVGITTARKRALTYIDNRPSFRFRRCIQFQLFPRPYHFYSLDTSFFQPVQLLSGFPAGNNVLDFSYKKNRKYTRGILSAILDCNSLWMCKRHPGFTRHHSPGQLSYSPGDTHVFRLP